ncbi:beta-ketoacyl-ACP reductase [Desulfosarcina ovata subsp. sediminis]|uniref:Beta-ketoacyl-ACP reductase n=1 Tax=Desulfosarcina ovata subsp. sediminis TaxID=885957 RepID=A0A5K7ZJ05_9BACT|nr:glucose 1-dehydrogenase [Desulfosarcina ovata]BBO80976.1 beta-ketoacyl-ACP reductase [Desulfosarcina ovata subsp. sediminis]
MDLNLKDNVVVITGGAQGVGRVIAHTFAKEGAQVVIGDLNVDAGEKVVREIDEIGGRAVFIQSDVSLLSDTDRLVAGALENFGRMDVMVHNAAVFLLGKFMDVAETDWRKVIDVIQIGAYNCARSVLPTMTDQKSGRIIFIGTDAARSGDNFQSIYASAKAGVVNFTKSLAMDVGPKGITVNTVSPAVVVTNENEAILDKLYGIKTKPEKAQKMLSAYPMRRLGQPEDIANMVVFLASPQASFITGQTISVNGGYSMV